MPTWLSEAPVLVALITVVGGVVGTLITTISNLVINRRDGKSRHGEIIKSLDILKDDNVKIKADLSNNAKEIEAVKINSKDITRYRLFHDMKKDIMAGSTTLERKREIAKLFASYKMLGGNGEIEMMYNDEFIELPLRKEYDLENDK